MKTRLVILHTLFFISLSGVVCSAVLEMEPAVTLGVSGAAFFFALFIFINWMNFISKVAIQSGAPLGLSVKRGMSLKHFDVIKSNQEKVSRRFNVSAEMISNLSHIEDYSEIEEKKDPISVAIQKIKVEMTKLKQEEGQRLWISQGLAKFGEILRRKGEIKEYSYQIISNLIKYVEANQGGLFIEYTDEAGERYLELTACMAYDKRKAEEKRITEGQGILGQCMLEKQFVFLTDIPQNYVRITSGLGDATPRNIVVAPLIFNEHFYGVIELALFEVMKPYQVEFLKEVCENIASEIASLKNISHTQDLLNDSNKLTEELQVREEKMKHNLEELAATQEEMANKQAELTGILNAINTTLATAEFNIDGKLVKHNNITEEIFGYRPHELLAKDIRLILGLHNETPFSHIVSGKISGGDFYTQCSDGEAVWLSTTFTVVRNNLGDPIKVLCLAQNITDKKSKEKEFERLSLVANNTDNAVIITDSKGLTEYVNEGFIKMTGYRAEEIIGKKPGQLLQGKDTNRQTVQSIRDKISRKQPVYEEILNYNKRGESYWVSIAINPVFNKDGQLDKFISIQADITETKNASLDFQYKLEAIGRSNCVLELDVNGQIIDVNKNFLLLTGYTLEGVRGKFHRLFLPIGEADTPIYKEFWEKLNHGESVSGEFSIRSRSGKSVWMRGVYNPILDMDGRTVKIVMFSVDVTEEKRLEQVAQKKQKELNSYLEGINNTVASAEFEPDGTFRNANEIFLKVLGYKAEDLAEKTTDFFMGDDHVTVMMWENLRLGKFFSGEFKMKDKTGKELWLSGTFNPMLIDSNLPQKIIMFAQFTTQEKEKLNDLNSMVQALKSTLPVLELNDQLACKTANDKFLKLFEISRMDFRSKSVFDFIDPFYHEVWKKMLDEILQQEFATIRLPLKLNGQVINYEVSISITRNLSGRISRVIMLLIKEVEEIVPVMAAM